MDGQVCCPGRFWGWDWGRGEGIIWLLSSAHPLVLPTDDRAMNKRPSFYLTPKAEHGHHKTDAHRRAGLPSQQEDCHQVQWQLWLHSKIYLKKTKTKLH